MPATANIHSFTQSGLGKAPFEIVAASHPKAMSNPAFFCEHCGTMLKHRYFVQSADERVSVVGIDCLGKSGDAGLIAKAKLIKKQAAHEAREDARKLARMHAQQRERDALNGKTKMECLEALEGRIIALQKAGDHEVSILPIAELLLHSNGSFGRNMLDHAMTLQSWSAGMSSAIKDIAAKAISGAKKKGGQAYLDALPAAQTMIDDCMAVVERYQDEMAALRDEYSKLERQRF